MILNTNLKSLQCYNNFPCSLLIHIQDCWRYHPLGQDMEWQWYEEHELLDLAYFVLSTTCGCHLVSKITSKDTFIKTITNMILLIIINEIKWCLLFETQFIKWKNYFLYAKNVLTYRNKKYFHSFKLSLVQLSK